MKFLNMNSVSLELEMLKYPELKKQDIQTLREWCKRDPHYPILLDSDLALFLHSNYYSVESAKLNIEKYFSIRSHVPEYFTNRDPINSLELRRTFDTVSVVCLDGKTHDGYKVILARLKDTDSNNYIFKDAAKLFYMVLDASIYEEGTCNGYIFIFDINGANLKHCRALDWMNLRKFFEYSNRGAPIKFQGFYYINTGSNNDLEDFVQYKIINNNFTDMWKKLQSRILFSQIYYQPRLANIMDKVPLDILPYEMGGRGGSLKDLHKKQIHKLENYAEWFAATEMYYHVESKCIINIFDSEREFHNIQVK